TGNKISETGKIYASRPSALGSWLLYPAVAYQKSYGITEESYGDTISASVTTVLIDGYFNITNETTKVGDVASSPFSINNIASEVKRTYKYDKYRDEEKWL